MVLKTGEYISVTPQDFKEAVEKTGPNFRGMNQQDAQEFLTHVLNQIEKELEPTDKEGTGERSNEAETAESHTKQQSIIDKIFGGSWSTHVECGKCKVKSVSETPFRNILLDIPKEGKTTLTECLHTYLKPEQLDD